MNTNTLRALRDLLTRAIEIDASEDAEPGAVEALAEFLEHGIAKHAVAIRANKLHRESKIAGPPTRPVDPVLSPRDDHHLVLNLTASTYIAVRDGTSTELPPGGSFLPFDPSDSLAEPMARGEIEVYPPGHHMPWADRLVAKLAWERRAMCASRVGDVDVLRECLAHVNFNAKQQIQARIDRIATDAQVLKNQSPDRVVAQRFRGSNGTQQHGFGAMGAPAAPQPNKATRALDGEEAQLKGGTP